LACGRQRQTLGTYAKTDKIFPDDMVVKMREAFIEGGGYAKLVHYPIDP
jgi:hypothetical protein